MDNLKRENEKLKAQIEKMKNCANCKFLGTEILLEDGEYSEIEECLNCDDNLSNWEFKMCENKSRELTKDEIKENFLNDLRNIARYWSQVEGTKERCCYGAVFSILSLLDGCSCSSPGFAVIPKPHPEDKEYRKNLKENYYPELPNVELSNISGRLHDEFYKNEND